MSNLKADSLYSRCSKSGFFKRTALIFLVLLVISTLLFSLEYNGSALKEAKAANGLTITKAQNGDVLLGGQTTYTITIKNDGSNAALIPSGYNLNVVDTLPPGMTYVSSSGAGLGSLPAPTISTVGPNQVLTWTNIKDLALNESYTITLVAQLSPAVLVGTSLTNNVNASVNTDPRNIGTQFNSGNASATGIALPFRLTKTTVQSTGVNQDTGECSGTGAGRQFYYKLFVENNYVGPSSNAVATDVLPDGVAFCGVMIPGGANVNTTLPTVVGPDPLTGITTLTWNLGALATSQQVILQPQVVILYKYRGTNNGAPNAIIPDQTTFINNGSLTGTYLGNNYTSNSSSTVTGRYATISKSSSVAIVATGDIVTYTLTPSTSSNYNASNMYIIDTIPNGQDYNGNPSLPPSDGSATDGVFVPCGANANLVPPTTHGGVTAHAAGSGVYECADGTTQVSWGVLNDIPATTPMTAGQQFSITFEAKVRLNYRNGTLPPVLAGDSFTNNVGMRFDADSITGLVPTNQGNGGLTNRGRWENAAAGQVTNLVGLNKNILGVTRGDSTPNPPGEGRVTGPTGVVQGGAGSRTLSRTAVAAVGDIVTFQLDFVGSGTADMQNIVVRDFLPLNYIYVPGSTTYFSSAPTPYTDTVNSGAINVVAGTGPDATYTPGTGPGGAGGVLEWYLTGVAGNNITPKNHSFRVQFKAQVQTGVVGFGNDNLGKVTGINTTGQAYSDRDQVTVTTLAPNLTLTKTNDSAALYPTGIVGNQTFTYSIVIRNTGNSTAYRIANLVDAVPIDIKYVGPPTITPGGAATFLSYVPTGSGFGGTLTFNNVADIAPGATLTISYLAQVQASPIVGTVETNTATIASYNSQPPASTVSATYPQVQGQSTVLIGGQTLTKTGVVHQPQVNGAGGRVTIGDQVDYTITFVLPPNATFPNGEIRDCLPLGFRYLTGSYSFTTPGLPLPGPGVMPANDGVAGFVVVAGNGPCANNRDYVTINFGTQNNTGAGITVVINLSATVTGIDRTNAVVLTGIGANASGPNQVYLFANNTQQGSPATSPNIDVYNPNLTLSKTRIRPGSPSPGGVNVDFLVTLGNTGGSTAYNIVNLEDTLDAGLSYVGAYISDNVCSVGTLVAGNLVPGLVVAGQNISIPVTPGATPPASLVQGTSYYVCIRATLPTTVSPSTTYNNVVRVGTGVGNNYFSAPPSFGSRRGYNNNQAPTASISTPPVSTTKSETSGNPSPNGSATPGEIISFTLSFTIPAGTTLYSPVVRDNFNFGAAGARLGTPTNLSTSPLTCTGGATPATSAYVFAVVGGFATYTFGANLTADAAAPSVCSLQFQTQVLNIVANTAGQPNISNDFTLNFNASTGTALNSTSNSVAVVIIEPAVTIAKTLVSAYDPLTGQATFRITVTNGAAASTAYDISVTDPFPAGLVWVSNTAPTTGPGVTGPAVTNTANSVTFTATSLAAGATTSFDVVVKGDGTLGAGVTVNNVASLTYYDLPTSINNNNNQADPTSRRQYTGSSTLPIVLAQPSFSKTPPAQTITVFGTVNFGLNITVPAFTTLFGVSINDTLPGGLILQPNGLSYGGVVPAACPAPGNLPAPGNGPLSLGDVVNNSANSCVYTVNVAAKSDGTVPAVGVGSASVSNTGNYSYSTTSGGVPINVTRTAGVTILAPILALVKTNLPTGPLAVGNTVNYTLNYSNTGPVAATGAVLTDPVPTGTTVVGGSITGGGTLAGGVITWNIGIIAAGGSGSLSFQVVVNSLPGSGAINNSATLTTNERPPLTSSVTNSTANLQAVKSVVAVGTTTPGATLTYTILLSNPTPATAAATNIVVTDPIPTNATYVGGSANLGGTFAANTVTWNVTSLAPNATVSLTFQVTVNSPLVNGTQIVNVAAYRSDQLLTPTPTNTTINPVVSAPILNLVKVNIPTGALGVDGTVTYNLTLTNTGNENAENVVISDTLPSGTTFVNASIPGSYNPGTNAVSWSLGTLIAPNGTVTVALTVKVAAGGNGQVPAGLTVTDIANYSYNNSSGGNSGSGQSNQVSNPTLSHSLSKSSVPVTGSTVSPGSTITYNLVYTNTGTGNFIAVTVRDPIPANTTYVNASANLGGGLVGGQVVWNLGAVNAGQVVNLTFQVLVNTPSANSSVIDNIANATGTGAVSGTVPGVVSNPTRHFIRSSPVFVITKSNSPTTPVQAGNVLTYSLVITNTGNADATNVVVQDAIPNGTTYVAGTAVGGNNVTFTANRLTWTITGLPINTSTTLQFQVTVNSPLLVNNQGIPINITNQASVISSTETGTLTPPGDSNIVSNPTVGLAISKKSSPNSGSLTYYNFKINYTLVFTNTGSLTLTGVQVADDIPAGTTFLNAPNGTFAAGGANGRGVVSWNIGSLAAGQSGTVTMEVRVDNPTAPRKLRIFNTASIRANELTGTIVSNQVNNPTDEAPKDLPTPTPTVVPTTTVTITPGVTDIPPTPTPGRNISPTPAPTDLVKVDPVILKTADKGQAVPGQTVQFTITVRNPGGLPDENVVVTDDVPLPFEVKGATSSQGTVTISGQKITVQIGTLPPGATVTIIVTTLVGPVTKGGNFTNTAFVTGLVDGQPIGGSSNAGGNVPGSGLSSSTNVTLPGLPNTGRTDEEADNGPLGAILLLLVGLGLATWATRRRNLRPNRRWWRGLSSLLLLLVTLNLFSLPLVQAVDEEWQHTSSVRPEASDYELFGKRLSTNRPAQTFTNSTKLTTATGPVVPVRLRIPALGIDTNIEALGLQSSGAMDVPSNIWNAGWLSSGPKPGEAGNAVIAGHRDSVKGEAVFWSLENLSPGDKVYVSDSTGNELTFVVTEVASYPLESTPLERVFGVSDQSQLNLITCYGDFVKDQHTYNKRLVVYTRLL